MRDHYTVLGVTETASAQEIKRAFRAQAKRLHPDRQANQDTSQAFLDLREAYEVLSDPGRRRDYDQERRGETPDSDLDDLFEAFRAWEARGAPTHRADPPQARRHEPTSYGWAIGTEFDLESIHSRHGAVQGPPRGRVIQAGDKAVHEILFQPPISPMRLDLDTLSVHIRFNGARGARGSHTFRGRPQSVTWTPQGDISTLTFG